MLPPVDFPVVSGASVTLVAYSLGIIDVDPIKYDLLFERFLNPGRVTMPDIDIDFPDIYRDEVIQYVKEKYGEKKVAGIIAIGTLKAKAVLDDVSKILKIPQEKTDRLKRYIELNSKLSDVYKNNAEFKNIIDNDDRLSLLYDVSLYFEGFPKNITTHASGIIISREDLDDIVPLVKSDNLYISSYEMGFLEELGLLKMDFLGNRNLTTIMDILKDIKKYENKNIDFLSIPLDDKETLDFINKLGDKIQDGCHEISFYLIEKYEMFKAVTSICKKGIDNSYYHSFILDDENNVYVRVQTICR